MTNTAAYADFQRAAQADPPSIAMVLGSGLGGLADRLSAASIVSFGDIPELAGPTVAGHRGELLLGTWAGRRVLVFAGRLHYYEGHPWPRVLAPVHIAKSLGVRTLLLTNAVGGIRADLTAGSLVALRGHVEWTRPGFWRETPKPSPYAPEMIARLQDAAQAEGFDLSTAVYGQVTGPCYETPAEVRALRHMGVDVVGMSTAREIQEGRDLGLECGAISCVCNQAAGITDGPVAHTDVLEVAARLRQRLTQLVERFLEKSP
jgi:purine-nucleoside phosphorylase